MGKPAISSALNSNNLEFFVDLMRDFPYFVFYGTLLGLVRQGDIIDGDDDIDFCINVNDRQQLLTMIKSNRSFIVREMNPDFIQIWRTIDNRKTIIDFYLYEDRGDFLSWRWSFEPNANDTTKHMHMDRSMLLPVTEISWHDRSVKVPAQPMACVEWIYGEKWKEKIAKNKYKTNMVNHKPFHQYR
jgi:hypothetical protein